MNARAKTVQPARGEPRLEVLRGIGATDIHWRAAKIEWTDLVGMKPQPIAQHFEKYHKLSKKEKQAVKATLPWIVGGSAKAGSTRKAAAMVSYSLLALDVEQGEDKDGKPEGPVPPSVAEVRERVRRAAIAAWVYTSTSHTAKRPRYRIMVPLAKPIPAKQYKAAVAALARALNLEAVAKGESYVLSQPMYLPAKLHGGEYETFVGDGAWFDPARDDLIGEKEPAAEDDAGDGRPRYTLDVVADMLKHVKGGHTRKQTYINVGHAIKHEYGEAGFDAWDQWAKDSGNYESKEDSRYVWSTLDKNKDGELVTMGSVVMLAREGGWKPPVTEFGGNMAAPEALLQPAGTLLSGWKPTSYLIDAVLPDREVIDMSGHAGAGKTSVMDHMCCCLLTGEAFAGHKVMKSDARIAYLASDDPDGVMKRLAAHKRLGKISSQMLNERMTVLTHAVPLERPAMMQLAAELEARNVNVVFIDVAMDFIPSDVEGENDNSGVLRWITQVRTYLCAGKRAVVLAVYPRKDAVPPELPPRGAGTWVSGTWGYICVWHTAGIVHAVPGAKFRGRRWDEVMFRLREEDTGLKDIYDQRVTVPICEEVTRAEVQAAEFDAAVNEQRYVRKLVHAFVLNPLIGRHRLKKLLKTTSNETIDNVKKQAQKHGWMDYVKDRTPPWAVTDTGKQAHAAWQAKAESSMDVD